MQAMFISKDLRQITSVTLTDSTLIPTVSGWEPGWEPQFLRPPGVVRGWGRPRARVVYLPVEHSHVVIRNCVEWFGAVLYGEFLVTVGDFPKDRYICDDRSMTLSCFRV